MSDECWIELSERGGEVEVSVKAPTLGPIARQVQRAADDLRSGFGPAARGNPSNGELNRITAELSQWFMQNDLDLALILGLLIHPPRDWRMVFKLDDRVEAGLKSALDELPLELLTLRGMQLPLVLHNRVKSLVHILDKIGEPASTSSTWPLRVLLVRSSPAGMGPVPAAIPVREAIFAKSPDLHNGGLLHIDVLSHEPGADGPPSIDELRIRLGHKPDILVYLGHGDLDQFDASSAPQNMLVLEKPNRNGGQGEADPYEALRLTGLLHDRPVRVVLLVGCMTAAGLPPDVLNEFEAQVPRWLRGSQGVAQALIDGSSGVEFACGMRFRIDGSDGVRFIESFFSALLGAESIESAGDLEHAVQEARRVFHLSHTPLAWAAPIVFRSLGEEPTFPFLATPRPTSHIIPEMLQKSRRLVWDQMAKLSSDQWGPFRALLDELENDIMQRLGNNTGLLIPEMHEVPPGHPGNGAVPMRVPVKLRGTLRVKELNGKLTTATGQARFDGADASPELAAAGFEFFTQNISDGELGFLIRNNTAADLPEGPLFHARIHLDAGPPKVYSLAVGGVKTEPAAIFCPGDNAVIAPEA